MKWHCWPSAPISCCGIGSPCWSCSCIADEGCTQLEGEKEEQFWLFTGLWKGVIGVFLVQLPLKTWIILFLIILADLQTCGTCFHSIALPPDMHHCHQHCVFTSARSIHKEVFKGILTHSYPYIFFVFKLISLYLTKVISLEPSSVFSPFFLRHT